MGKKPKEKIKRQAIYFIFITLFLVSLFVLLNERFALLEVEDKSLEKVEDTINIIDRNTSWSYLDMGENPGVGNVWTTENYDASLWKKDSIDSSFTPSYFLRYEFYLEEELMREVQAMEGKIEYEAAVIIYLNGSIIFAGNLPEGGYESNSDIGVSQVLERTHIKDFKVTELSALKPGKNIIGVEIHRQGEDQEDIYFDFSKLDLLKDKAKEPLYNTESLLLQQGDGAQEILVNWTTDSSDFYRLEYLEAQKDKGLEDFSELGQSRLMGRKEIGKSKFYQNRVSLEGLKYNTEYLYRIFKIGSKVPSKEYSFKTGGKSGFSFLALEGRYLSKQASSLVGEGDFIITSLSIEDRLEEDLKIEEAFRGFRRLEILKEKPVFLLQGDYEKNPYAQELYKDHFGIEGEGQEDKGHILYQDTLIIGIDASNKDLAKQKAYVRENLEKARRKWNIVIINDGNSNKELMDMLEETKVDLILDIRKGIYKLSVENLEILVERYSLESGEKIHNYILEK